MFSVAVQNKRIAALLAVAALSLAGCGDSGSSAPTVAGTSTSFSVTPALGAVYNGTVTVYSKSGAALGTASTGTTGTAALTLSGYTTGEPVVIKLTLAPGASYFNEKTGANENVTTTTSLLSIAPSVTSGGSAGVSALTNMAAQYVGLSADMVGTGALPVVPTSDAINQAVAKTNLAVGLPANTDILKAPVPATQAAPNPTDTLGNLLAKLAIYSTQPSPLARATALAEAVTTSGTVDPTRVGTLTALNNNLILAGNMPVTVYPAVTAPTLSDITSAVISVTTGAKVIIPSVDAQVSGGM